MLRIAEKIIADILIAMAGRALHDCWLANCGEVIKTGNSANRKVEIVEDVLPAVDRLSLQRLLRLNSRLVREGGEHIHHVWITRR